MLFRSRFRRNTLQQRLTISASVIARALAGELRNGGGAAAAITSAATGDTIGADVEARVVMAGITARLTLGDPTAVAIEQAIADALSRCQRPVAALAAVGRLLQSQVVHGGDHGGALHRLADVLDADRRARAAARAELTEIRVAAYAIPVLTAAAAALLVTADGGARLVLFAPLGMLLLLTCASTAMAGVMLSTRLTA